MFVPNENENQARHAPIHKKRLFNFLGLSKTKMSYPYLQAPYYYGTRTNYPYPPLPSGGIGYGGSFGTGSYSLGGGYYGGQSYLARPLTSGDVLLGYPFYGHASGQGYGQGYGQGNGQGNGQGYGQGYPAYESEGVLGQVRPEYWLAQRRSFESIQPAHIALADNRPVYW